MRIHPPCPRAIVATIALLALLGSVIVPLARAATDAPCGILVSPLGTDLPGNGLSTATPCRTIGFAIQRAEALGLSCVFVGAGTYDEVLSLRPGIDLVGGFDLDWMPGTYDTPGHEARVVGGLDAASGEYLTARATTAGATRLAELVLQGPNAFGASANGGRSSRVLHVVGATLTLDHVMLQAGAGAAGVAGTAGADAASLARAATGNTGGDGQEYNSACDATNRGAGGGGASGSCADSPSLRVTGGGAGGPGGTMDTDCGVFSLDLSARPGTAGSPAAFTSGASGTGGPGGPANSGSCGSGGGTPGANGQYGVITNGAAGAGGTGVSFNAGGYWYADPGGAGGTGENGGGGGGGGGGCAAKGGGGGGGGGGSSLGIEASGGAVLTLQNCTIVRGSAGAGGAGGSGGQGQPGGLGGPGGLHPGASAAGAGGNGGHGGHGGGGGGGRGGSSIGILATPDVSLTTTNLVVLGGAAAAGGAGGIAAPAASLEDDDGLDGAAGAAGTLAAQLVVPYVSPAAEPVTSATRSLAAPASAAATCDISCVVSVSGPSAAVPLSFSGVAPNPVVGVSLVRFGLPREARVTLDVFDPAGRRVRTLCDATFAAGTHAVRWDGATAAGGHPAPGVYLLRFRALGRTLTRTAIVTR